MSQLRAKQIKLVAQGDLIFADASGNGSILTKGSSKQFLRVKADGSTLEYAALIAGDVGFDKGASSLASTDANAAILEVNSAIVGEVTRATAAEGVLTTNLAAEVTRATGVEGQLTTDLAAEVTRATAAEGVLTTNLTAEVTRATGAEDVLTTNLAGEVTRATAAEGVLTTNLAAEVTRATGAETALGARIDALGNVFSYRGTLDAATGTLPASPVAGDVYKITAEGDFAGALSFVVSIGDMIVKNETGWDKFDNTDPVVQGTASRVSVNRTGANEYTVDIASGYAGQSSITTLGTIATGTWEASIIDRVHGGTGVDTSAYLSTDLVLGDFSKLAKGSDNMVLTVVGGALAYGYSSVLRDAAGVAVADASSGKLVAVAATVGGDDALAFTTKGFVESAIAAAQAATTLHEVSEDFDQSASAANAMVSIASAPIAGSVKVFFNGIKLKNAGFTVSGQDVTLVDSAIGYSVEAGDLISVVYLKNS